NLAGDISGRVTEASKSIEMVFAYINEKLFRKIITVFTTIVALYYTHAVFAFIFTTWLIFFLGVSFCFSKKINQYSVEFSKDKVNISGRIVDSISNVALVKMFSAHKFESDHLKIGLNKVIRSDRNLQWFMLKLRYVLGLSCTMMISLMIYYTISWRASNNITTGQCVMIISLCVAVVDDVWDMAQDFGDLFEYIGAFNQSLTLFSKYDIIDQKDAPDLRVTNPVISFNNVSFNYMQNSNSFINQSIEIPAYQKVGLAGFSGSGKTTFTRLIARIYDIDSGSILIDNQNIKEISLDSLNKNISFIAQEPMLFHRTIAENIAYARPQTSYDEIMQAAKQAHIHEHIMSLPNGYDTICGERGNNLSGGQRQRISIARAFLKDAPILIIDEATSSLDSRTEKLIQQSLSQLMQEKTVIVIAHRLATLVNMDRILVFDKGHVVEDGNHEQLINNGKMYQLLWEHY
ncbi:MAG: hypothetical protein DGJ47_000609, partial [Rickettsiaceae bacterium]